MVFLVKVIVLHPCISTMRLKKIIWKIYCPILDINSCTFQHLWCRVIWRKHKSAIMPYRKDNKLDNKLCRIHFKITSDAFTLGKKRQMSKNMDPPDKYHIRQHNDLYGPVWQLNYKCDSSFDLSSWMYDLKKILKSSENVDPLHTLNIILIMDHPRLSLRIHTTFNQSATMYNRHM